MKLKELCEKYNVPYDKYHANRCRKQLDKYCVFDKVGNNYFIVRERTEEEREFMTKFTNCKMMLKDLTYKKLSEVDGNSLRMNTKEFLEYFGIVNNHYKDFSYPHLTENKIQFLEKVDMTEEMLSAFYIDVNPILNRLLKEVFKDLENELLIKKNDIMMYGIKEVYVDEDGNKNYFITKRQATTNDVENYLRISREIMLDKFGFDRIDKANYFQRKTILGETCRQLGWDFIYNDYELVLNKQGLKQQEVTREMLNKEVCKKIMLSKQGNLKEYDLDFIRDCVNAIIRL